ncbi:hypothetical protein B296_00053144 [Ensete ventricosum]|uniref:Uncharacterized protein n=1 Tax=Ensete ventricosum TaxID=4639 RepID=A0A426Y9M9_ENSVE|nr:hypothetical protein B296_00053144 [Ensete ventricosum]
MLRVFRRQSAGGFLHSLYLCGDLPPPYLTFERTACKGLHGPTASPPSTAEGRRKKTLVEPSPRQAATRGDHSTTWSDCTYCCLIYKAILFCRFLLYLLPTSTGDVTDNLHRLAVSASQIVDSRFWMPYFLLSDLGDCL